MNYKIYWLKIKSFNCPFTQGYVGITKRNVMERYKEHLKYGNKHLKYAIEKYGEKNIIVKILKKNITEEMALKLELEYRPNDKIGWNIVKGGGKPPLHIKHTEETKKKISFNNKNKRKICCITNNKTYKSISEAAKDTKIDHRKISDICSGRRKTNKGFSFKYID